MKNRLKPRFMSCFPMMPPDYSGAEFSYYSGSMKSESPNARDMAKLEKLVDISRELIDLSGS